MSNLIGILENQTIKAKLAVLSGFLLLALIVVGALGGINTVSMKNEAAHTQDNLTSQKESIDRYLLLNSTLREFGEMKYWLTDLAVSWQNESETFAEEAQERLYNLLEQTSEFMPEESTVLKGLVEESYDLAIEAVDSYVDGNRVQGNSLLSEARRRVVEADSMLVTLANKEKEQMLLSNQSSLDNAINSVRRASVNIGTTVTIVSVVVILSFFLTLLIVRSLIGPLHNITSVMTSLAEGSLDAEVPPVTKNEIGEMAHALNIFKENKIKADRLAQEQEMEQKNKLKRAEHVDALIKDFESKTSSSLNTFASAATELNQTSESMKVNTDNVSDKASSVSKSAQQTSSNVHSVASAAEEMAASVQEISAQILKTTGVVNEAVNKAEHAGKSVKSLEQGAVEMGEVVGLIKDIAEQINLLALNATIESARAGEAGKGFAVVASEVKNLASQTTKATEDISAKIETMQGVSTQVVDALTSIRESVDNVNEYSSSVASAMEEQSATTNEIARNMQIASQNTNEVNGSVDEIKDSASQASNSSNEVLNASKMLSKEAEGLNAEISKFLSDVKEG